MRVVSNKSINDFVNYQNKKYSKISSDAFVKKKDYWFLDFEGFQRSVIPRYISAKGLESRLNDPMLFPAIANDFDNTVLCAWVSFVAESI